MSDNSSDEKLPAEEKAPVEERAPAEEKAPANDKSTTEFNGKKVFFLFPPNNVQNQVITELAQQEIEVYVAKDYTRLNRALKNYTDSIVYINIDDGMSEPQWEQWIATLLSAVPTVKIGILSSSTDEELKNKYLEKLKITCGFIKMQVDMSKASVKILEILGEMDVKGRRKYLRALVDREANATINMPVNGDFKNGVIRDVSVVGVSCIFESDPGLKKNNLIKDIQIRLQTMLLKVEAVVFGAREENGQIIYVLIFTQRVDPDVKVKIRKYIQQNLQGKMDSEIN